MRALGNTPEPMAHITVTLSFSLGGFSDLVVQSDCLLKLLRIFDLLRKFLDRLDNICIELPLEEHGEQDKEEEIENQRHCVEDQKLAVK